MFGFRPKLGCHDAIRKLGRLIEGNKTNYVVDADIKGYFNNMVHERILELIAFRIADPNILWLTKKLLTSGVVEDNKWRPTTKGAEQGNLASPVIANIYMHYGLALWYELKFKKTCRGTSGLVIYADDFVATFQYKDDAKRFLAVLKDRFALFGLELEPTKTRLIAFGRYAESNLKARHQKGKPDTFDFLGFTHYCSKSKRGWFRVKRKTAKKKLNLKLKEFNVWIKRNKELRLKELFTMVNLKLVGHYRYFGITDNSAGINSYFFSVKSMLFKWLNHRSQRRSYTWEEFDELLKIFHSPDHTYL
jgi:group II intron reverse transcriptase/maturase